MMLERLLACRAEARCPVERPEEAGLRRLVTPVAERRRMQKVVGGKK